MKSMFPDTEPEYMAWAVHGYMYDFGLSREDAITTAKKTGRSIARFVR